MSTNTDSLVALARNSGAKIAKAWDADEPKRVEFTPAELEVFAAALSPQASTPTAPPAEVSEDLREDIAPIDSGIKRRLYTQAQMDAALSTAPAEQAAQQPVNAAEELLTEIRKTLNESGVWHLGMDTVDVIKLLVVVRKSLVDLAAGVRTGHTPDRNLLAQRIEAIARGISEQAPSTTAPKGFKLLRRMPNASMVEAGREAMSPEKFVSHCRALWVWNAMWDAAPDVADAAEDYGSFDEHGQRVESDNPAPDVDVPAMPEPTVPDNIIVAIQEYGDARADAGSSAARMFDVVKELRKWAARLAAAAHAAPTEPSDAVRDVLAERRRQVDAEGWTPEHDDDHGDGAMAYAAAAYAVSSAGQKERSFFVTSLWAWTGWASSWFKPKSRRGDLVRSGALIIAEIERLDRAARKGDTR